MLLLIHPPLGTWGDYSYIPYGLLSIKGTLERHFSTNVEIIDLELLTKGGKLDLFSYKFFEEATKLILSKRPKVVGLGTLVSNYHIVINLCRKIKEANPDITIVLGGPQVSSLVEETLNHFHDYVDIIVVGEGERTIVDLVKSGFDKESMGQIDGIAFWGKKAVKTKPAELIENLDSLPEMDMNHLRKYYELYIDSETEHPSFANIEVGRGCKFNCSFCSTAPLWRRVDRRKTPERIFEEMNKLVPLATSFFFSHDNLTSDKKHLAKLCSYLIEKNSKFRWTAYSRGDVLDYDELSFMKDAGCDGLFIGVESGSKHMQKVFNKNLNLDECVKTFKWCEELNIRIRSIFVLGHPEETLSDLNNTLSMALKFAELSNTFIRVTKLCPLTGSKDYTKYLDKIYFTENTSDLCRRPFRYPETEKLINDYPTVFAGFGVYPCQYMSDPELTILVGLYDVVLDKYAGLVRKVLNDYDLEPTGFFETWMDWYYKNHEDTLISQEWIRQTFPSFFRKVFIS